MDDTRKGIPGPGEAVVLEQLPAGLIDGLPDEDQKAITDILGKPIRLVGYDDDGRAELEFTDAGGCVHFIYVGPEFIRRC